MSIPLEGLIPWDSDLRKAYASWRAARAVNVLLASDYSYTSDFVSQLRSIRSEFNHEGRILFNRFRARRHVAKLHFRDIQTVARPGS